MSIIIISIAAVLFMPIIAKVPLVFVIFKEGKYDNRHPRQQQASLKGLGARALAAHNNCFEAICYFAPTVLLVIALDMHNLDTVKWCVVFVVLRLLYICFYWLNLHLFRSTAWTLSIAALLPHYWLLLA
jgi:uncharacterized MAPEG superfamily protein